MNINNNTYDLPTQLKMYFITSIKLKSMLYILHFNCIGTFLFIQLYVCVFSTYIMLYYNAYKAVIIYSYLILSRVFDDKTSKHKLRA